MVLQLVAFAHLKKHLVAVLYQFLHLKVFLCMSDIASSRFHNQSSVTVCRCYIRFSNIPLCTASSIAVRVLSVERLLLLWLNVMLWVSLLYMLPGAVACVPSRAATCPVRAIMLLQQHSRTSLASRLVSNTLVRYTVKKLKRIFSSSQESLYFSSYFLPNVFFFFPKSRKKMKAKITSMAVCFFDNVCYSKQYHNKVLRYYNKVFFTNWLFWLKRLHCLKSKILNFLL